MVSYRHNGAHKCTGFLYSENFVIIAVHCFEEYLIHSRIPNFNNYSVWTGIADNFYNGGEPNAIKQMIAHKSYNFLKRKPQRLNLNLKT